MSLSNADLATLVLIAGDADEIFTQPGVASGGNPGLPAPTDKLISYLTTEHFVAIGQLRCDDLFISKGRNVYYGLVLRCVAPVGPMKAGDHLVAVRGTMDPLEWANDACGEFLIPAPGAQGMVGSGFWAVYASMKVASMAGEVYAAPAARSIAAMVKGVGGQVFVTGHSLGAAMATYLTLDLVAASVPVVPAFFASPKPGSEDFAQSFLRCVPSFDLVDFVCDLVPMLPSLPSVSLKAGGPTQNVHILQRGAPGAPAGLLISPITAHDCSTYANILNASAKVTQAA